MNEINNKPLFKVFLFVLLCTTTLVFPNLVQAKLTQTIDRTDIHAGESFVLTIQLDQDTGAEPDLSVVPKEFTIISNSQYQQMSYVNGRSNTIKGWKLKLSTLKTGKIVIPSISVGKDKTQPIELIIKDTSDRIDLSGQKKAIFLESTVDQQQGYVQQQIVFTVKLYRAVNTHYARLSEPAAGDSIIEKLGDDIQYDKQIDTTRYVVTERRYAVFPQQSGDLTIDSINFTADVNDPNSRGNNRFLNTTRPVSVNSKAIKVTVLPQPDNSSNPWMPATEVVLADKWSNAGKELTVGEPVTWTLLLYAQGLSESQISEITLPKVDGLQFYPDTPQKERQINDKGILGQRIEKLAVIPSKSGSITIPEIHVKWWDVKSNSEKIATLATRTFNVLPSTKDETQVLPSEQIAPIVESKPFESSADATQWQTATIIVSILWLLTLLAYFKRPSNYNAVNNKSNRKINAADLVEPMTKTEVFSQLLRAIKNQHLEQIEAFLLQWVSLMAPEPIHSLGHLVGQLQQPEIRVKLQLLESQRYSSEKNDYRCDLSKTDLQLIAETLVQKRPTEGSEIPPLYSR